jgi:hypothetical protein
MRCDSQASSWPATLQALALVASPRLRLRHLVVIVVGLRCMLCEQILGATIVLICDKCSQGWHMGRLMPPMEN